MWLCGVCCKAEDALSLESLLRGSSSTQKAILAVILMVLYLVVVLIWTVTPYGVSASISVQPRSGWVGIPFWKRRHETLTIDKRHETFLVASRMSRDSLEYLHDTQCGLCLHDREAIDITSPSIHAHVQQSSLPHLHHDQVTFANLLMVCLLSQQDLMFGASS